MIKLHEFHTGQILSGACGKLTVEILGFCSQLYSEGKELPARREMVIYRNNLGTVAKNNIQMFRAYYGG